LYGFAEYMVAQRQQPAAVVIDEVDRWLREPTLDVKNTPEELKVHMQSKSYNFPIIKKKWFETMLQFL
jgi:hypothetical protein